MLHWTQDGELLGVPLGVAASEQLRGPRAEVSPAVHMGKGLRMGGDSGHPTAAAVCCHTQRILRDLGSVIHTANCHYR